MVKNRFYYERNHISAYILRFGCFEILLFTRIDSLVMHDTRVGTLTARGSTTLNNRQKLAIDLFSSLRQTLGSRGPPLVKAS